MELQLKTVKVGETVLGRIVKKDEGRNGYYVDIGTKQEAFMPQKESAVRELRPNEELMVKVISYNPEEEEFTVSRKLAVKQNSWETVQRLAESGEKKKVVVKRVVNKGVVVDIESLEGFLPLSLIKPEHKSDLNDLINKEIEVKVIEVDLARRRVVVSEVDSPPKKEEILEKISVGDVLEGKVKTITEYGAFIDVGGVDGLLHVSEISWEKIDDVSSVLKPGDTVKVKVIKVDPANGKLSLSIKALTSDPWATLEYSVGDVVKGEVVEIKPFGAIVKLRDGVRGLLHISELSPERVENVEDVVKLGDVVDAKIIELNKAERKLRLSIKALKSNARKVYRFGESGEPTLGELLNRQ